MLFFVLDSPHFLLLMLFMCHVSGVMCQVSGVGCIFQGIGPLEALWADAFYKSKCPCVCLFVRLLVCVFTFEVPF